MRKWRPFPVSMVVTQPVSDPCDAPPAERVTINCTAYRRPRQVRLSATGCNSDRSSKPILYRSRRSANTCRLRRLQHRPIARHLRFFKRDANALYFCSADLH